MVWLLLMARFVVAIDPGIRGCGAAAGVDGQIVASGYVIGEPVTKVKRAGAWVIMAKQVIRWVDDLSLKQRFFTEGELVIELPQVYQGSHQRGQKVGTNPGDLIELSAVVGAVTYAFSRPTTVYLPCEWKGQVPKDIMHDRARGRLSPGELAIIKKALPRDSLSHNVWDAVAMLLKHVGRL
jgi:hypothetical protein